MLDTVRGVIVATVGKAVYFTLVVVAVDVTFIKSLVLVIASAVGTGAFAVVVALIQSRDAQRTHKRLERLERGQVDIRGKMGARKRSTDPPPPPPDEPERVRPLE